MLRYTCNVDYDMTTASEEPFGLGMFNDSQQQYYTDNAWVFTPSSEIEGVPIIGSIGVYGGGGFIANLDVNSMNSMRILQELKENLWLDRQTRAVFVEFTLYSPNSDLFVYVTLIAEFPTATGILHMHQVQVLRAYKLGASTIYLTMVGAFFIIYLIGYVVVEIRSMRRHRKKYFTFVKTYINLLIIACGLAMCGFFIMRSVKLEAAMTKIEEDSSQFIPFSRVATLDDTYKYCVAFMNGIAIMKLILLLKLNRRIALLMMALRSSIGPLSSFLVIFIFLTLAYATLVYLSYSPFIEDFGTYISTLQSMFGVAMGAFGMLDDMEMVNLALTRFIFLTYMITMNWVMLNVLIILIMESHEDLAGQEPDWRDQEITKQLFRIFFVNLKKKAVQADQAGIT